METDIKGLFQITEAAHACGVSRSTLMRMEEKGLLAPAYVAPESGRRYYEPQHRARFTDRKIQIHGTGRTGDRGLFCQGRRGVGAARGVGGTPAGAFARCGGAAAAGGGS